MTATDRHIREFEIVLRRARGETVEQIVDELRVSTSTAQRAAREWRAWWTTVEDRPEFQAAGDPAGYALHLLVRLQRRIEKLTDIAGRSLRNVPEPTRVELLASLEKQTQLAVRYARELEPLLASIPADASPNSPAATPARPENGTPEPVKK